MQPAKLGETRTMATDHGNTHTQGSVKDPEHDGRLKENREAGRTKGTTEASAERAHGHPQERQQSKNSGEHSSSHSSSGSHSKSSGEHSSSSHSGGSSKSEGESDLKSREYTDKDGNVHHHTKTSSHK